MDIVEFLTAQYDEDEQRALACIRGGNPTIGIPGQWNTYIEGGDDGWAIEDDAAGTAPGIIGDKAVAEFIAAHDPARVLADIAAKRQLLKVHRGDHICAGWEGESRFDDVPCLTAHLMAAPYADRPGYNPVWAV